MSDAMHPHDDYDACYSIVDLSRLLIDLSIISLEEKPIDLTKFVRKHFKKWK